MKKLIFLLTLVLISFAAFAGSEKVKNYEGKVVGSVDWNYSIQTYESRDGSFTTITATNNSPEYISITFKTDAGGCEGMTIAPHETEKVVIGTDKRATNVYCIGVSIR